MKNIEEIAFTINYHKCTYRVYKQEEEVTRRLKVPAEIGEVTLYLGYKYIDKQVKVTKYTIKRIFETDKESQETIICETESYATVLTIMKAILTEYIETINKLQSPLI